MSLDQSDPIKSSRVRRIINQHRSRYKEGIPVSVIKTKSEAAGIDREFVEEFIEHEKKLDRLYSPEDGKVSVT